VVASKTGLKQSPRQIRRGNIQIPRERIAEFCRAHGIKKLSFFGSVLREDFTSKSDVDILVEFEPGTIIGFIGLAGLEIELSKILGHRVDLRTPADLSRYFRQKVLDRAEIQYVSEGG
jgi:predicted nucleotidyltransferase